MAIFFVIHVLQDVQGASIQLSVLVVKEVTHFSTSNVQLLSKITINGQMEVSEDVLHIA